MPAAAPLPRSPSVLTTYSAADLLTAPGCPVCRYAGEASDRHLSWFALEAHADATAITRLTGSLGTCARHTRRLMGQPGAAVRLTALYRYIVPAARDRLAGWVAPLAACPMCEHDDAAARRALDMLLDGLSDPSVRDRCRELGGLCVPHLTAAVAEGHRRIVVWLTETTMATVIGQPPGLEWMAGDVDRDADVRAILRRGMPVSAQPGSYVCAACLAGARAEQDFLGRLDCLSSTDGPRDPGLLCASHLGDAAVLAGRSWRLVSLLAWQADRLVAAGSRRSATSSRISVRTPDTWRRVARRGPPRQEDCVVCGAMTMAAQHALAGFCHAMRASPLTRDQPVGLCVRHLLALRSVDPRAGQMTASGAVELADSLSSELAEAFLKNTWEHRHQAKGPEATAWRRAAAFLDGRVFCGSPPRWS